ncbi:MAG: WbqC family protein [Bacteroidota bacterium]|nr:WbqC family protein [Bacteroidota bacterium]
MKIAVMQPYFFPYIGYWQLINSVDIFIIYDDVNFIKRGYINRNNILINNVKHLFTLALIKSSQNKKINEILIGENNKKILRTIEQSYLKAPFFHDIFPIIEDIFSNKEKDLSKFLGNSLQIFSKYLDINTKFEYSSMLENDKSLQAQDRLIEISKILNATDYINAIGGEQLYDKNAFSDAGINLSFIQTELINYKQFNNKFIPNLSIIDVMMFNSKEDIKEMLKKYTLV